VSATAPDDLPELVLRPFAAADCELLVGWIDSAAALLQWSGPDDFAWPLDRAQLEGDLRSTGAQRMIFSAIDPLTGETVGHVALSPRRAHGVGHLSRVLVAPEHRGRRFGIALMRAIVKVGFDELHLRRLQLGVYTFNASAIECYEAVGFVVEGCQRATVLGSDGCWSSFAMGIGLGDRAGRARGSGLGVHDDVGDLGQP
jgi:RimJ/RimL family protein N-acetyltransferase